MTDEPNEEAVGLRKKYRGYSEDHLKELSEEDGLRDDAREIILSVLREKGLKKQINVLENPVQINLKEPEGIGGWLILPFLHVIIAPFIFGSSVVEILSEVGKFGGVLTDKYSQDYIPNLLPLISFELIGNSCLAILSVFLIFQFYKRKAYLPKLMIGFYAGIFIFVLADNLWVSFIPELSEKFDILDPILLRTFLSGVLWISYFLVSKRVKNTFIN